MNKTEFRKKVFPLTKKEFYYLSNQKNISSKNYFDQESDTFDDFPNDQVLNLQGNLSQRLSITKNHHALFFDGQKTPIEMLNLPIFCCKQTRFSKVPIHTRNYLEIKYIYSGSCVALLNDKKIYLSTGDLLLLEQGSKHSILPAGKNDLIFNFQMDRSYFTQSFIKKFEDSDPITHFLTNAIDDSTRHTNYCFFQNRKDDDEDIRFLIESILCEYLDPSTCYKTILDASFLILFGKLVQRYMANQEEPFQNDNKSYITEIVLYIRDHCDTIRSLQEVATHFGYNKDYLSKLLKRTVNQSYKNLITTFRLEKSSEMLAHTEKPIYQIAEDCGFSNLSFFYQKFQNFYHCSPAEYRKH